VESTLTMKGKLHQDTFFAFRMRARDEVVGEAKNKLSWLIGIPRGEYGAMALEVPVAHFIT
jgi:hypothetical protein